MNSDSLVPLLLAYGEDLPRDIAALPDDGTAAVEQALLRTMRTALEGVPAPAPPAEAVAAVLAAARGASSGSDLAHLRATLAGEDDGSVESALLRTTLSAVGRAGRPSPPAEVVASVLAAAREAADSSELAALRAALIGESVAGVASESALLQTTIQALGALPRSAPPPDVVASLIEAAGAAARASELSPVRAAVGLAAGGTGAEEAVLRTTWQAVERTPRSAPPVSALHAVLSAAGAAVPSPLREAAAVRRAADRPAAARFTVSYRRFAYLTAAVAFVGLVGAGLWASVDGRRDSTQSLASLDEAPARVPDPGPQAPAETNPTTAPPGADDAAEATTGDLLASELDRAAANGPATRIADTFRSAEQPSFARPASPPPPPPAPADAQEREGLARDERAVPGRVVPAAAGVGLAAVTDGAASPGAGLAGAPAVAPAWEAGSDVRLLSMRLQALQQGASGLAWDEPPSPLGAAETGAPAPEGFNAVGTRSAPARFQVRVGPPGSD